MTRPQDPDHQHRPDDHRRDQLARATWPPPRTSPLVAPHLPPRRAVLVAGAGGLAALLAACGGSGSATTGAEGSGDSGGGGGWTFTDDRGQRIQLDAAPTRLVGYADEASALWAFGVTPVGIWHRYPLDEDDNFADRDLSGIEVLGASYGEIDLEALAALEPDLLVTTDFPADSSGTFGDVIYSFTDQAQQERAASIAPILAIGQLGTSEEIIARNSELAEALGADPDAAEVTRARTEWEAACERVRTAAAKGLTIGALYATPSEGLYWAKPADDPGLAFYQSLGVQFFPLEADPTAYFWEAASWENAGRYTPDVVLYTAVDALDAAGLKAQPTFASTPAAQADQLFPWYYGSMDPVQQARVLNALAEALESSEKVT